MNKKSILEDPSTKRRDEFLAAVRRSRKLHGRWASPPATPEMFDAYLERLRKETHLGYWVRTDLGELGGVFNINEIVRGTFCSGYLGYYAFAPHHRHGYMKQGLRAILSEAFGRQRLHRLESNIQPENAASRRLVRGILSALLKDCRPMARS
jgi:ribosomal-protein-alanine N-acetyltransferase